MNTLTEKELARRKPLPEGLPITFHQGYPLVDMSAIEVGTILTDGEITVEVILNPGDMLGLGIKSPCYFCCLHKGNCTLSLDKLLSKQRTVCFFGTFPRRVFRLVEKEKSNDD